MYTLQGYLVLGLLRVRVGRGVARVLLLRVGVCVGVWGSGFRVQGAGCRVQGSGFRVQGSARVLLRVGVACLSVSDFGFRVSGFTLWFVVWGVGFGGIWGLGCRV